MKKRMLILYLSLGTIIAYGYALGGAGGYLFGKGRPFVAAGGLVCGTLCAWAALRLWRSYLNDIEANDAHADHTADDNGNG